jgi:hypothetical protein
VAKTDVEKARTSWDAQLKENERSRTEGTRTEGVFGSGQINKMHCGEISRTNECSNPSGYSYGTPILGGTSGRIAGPAGK